MAEPWVLEILDFWFGLQPEQWWKSDPELGEDCHEGFTELWEEQRQRVVSTFLGSLE